MSLLNERWRVENGDRNSLSQPVYRRHNIIISLRIVSISLPPCSNPIDFRVCVRGRRARCRRWIFNTTPTPTQPRNKYPCICGISDRKISRRGRWRRRRRPVAWPLPETSRVPEFCCHVYAINQPTLHELLPITHQLYACILGCLHHTYHQHFYYYYRLQFILSRWINSTIFFSKSQFYFAQLTTPDGPKFPPHDFLLPYCFWLIHGPATCPRRAILYIHRFYFTLWFYVREVDFTTHSSKTSNGCVETSSFGMKGK